MDVFGLFWMSMVMPWCSPWKFYFCFALESFSPYLPGSSPPILGLLTGLVFVQPSFHAIPRVIFLRNRSDPGTSSLRLLMAPSEKKKLKILRIVHEIPHEYLSTYTFACCWTQTLHRCLPLPTRMACIRQLAMAQGYLRCHLPFFTWLVLQFIPEDSGLNSLFQKTLPELS